MQPDITRLNLGTSEVQPAAVSSMYNGGAARSSQYTPRQMIVTDITKEFSDASAGMSNVSRRGLDTCLVILFMQQRICTWMAVCDQCV